MPRAEAEAVLQLSEIATTRADTSECFAGTLHGPQSVSRQGCLPSSNITAAPHFELYEPHTDLVVMRQLAVWCQRFSPIVGVEDGAAPESLLFDISGTTHLFHNERSMARRVLRELQELDLHVRVAVADTVGAAWAVAHFGTAHRSQTDVRNIPLIVPAGEQQQSIQALPVQALRLPASVVNSLRELDLCCVRQVLDLPKAALPSRFGNVLHQRLDQALGHLAETITPERAPQPTVERQQFDFPISQRRAIEITIERLLQRTIRVVQARRHGIQRLQIALQTESDAVTEFSVGLIRPSVLSEHLMHLVRTRLERVQTPGDICEIRVVLTASAPLLPAQETLFACRDAARAARERELLLERISNRLGETSVVRAAAVADSQPERAVRFEPLTENRVGSFDVRKGDSQRLYLPADVMACPASGFQQRPMKLKVRPMPIEVLSTTADGSPQAVCWSGRTCRIIRSLGPERIHTGWWRDENIQRDYYRVETDGGQRLWLFRDGVGGGWYLHGVFD